MTGGDMRISPSLSDINGIHPTGTGSPDKTMLVE